MLERVIDALTQRHVDRGVSEVVSTKFLAPLKPSQAFSLHFAEHGESIDFECRSGEITLARGRLKLIPIETPQ